MEQILIPPIKNIRQHRTIPALRLKHRSGSCGTASALPKCSIMSGCGTRIVLRGQKPLAPCDRCPCFGSLFPPLAALTFAASSIICAFGLASAAPRSPYQHLELCGIAFTTSQVSPPHRNPIALLPYPPTARTVHLHPLPPPQNKRHVPPPYLYHKVGTCRYIIMILSRQSHQAMQPSAKLLRLAFSFCWLRLAMISLLRPIRLVLKWKNGRSGTVKISTGRM